MREFKDKTAFITGGAGGFGVAFATALLAQGARVVLADRDQGALDRAVAGLGAGEARARGVACDVAQPDSLAHAARAAIAAFGPIHLVFNNAGIAGRCAGLEAYAPADWRKALDVNLLGVVNGVAAFLPHMREHGEGGHIVNTASIAGLLGQPHWSPYSASKAAVVSLSESLFYELKGEPIGVSVLCPGFAKTGLAKTGLAPAKGSKAETAAAEIAQAVAAGMAPSQVAARMMQGLRDGDLYIFTHPDMRAMLTRRFARLEAAYAKAEAFTG